MGPEHEELLHGVKLAAVAVISAVLTASIVISAGNALKPRPLETAPVATSTSNSVLIHTVG